MTPSELLFNILTNSKAKLELSRRQNSFYIDGKLIKQDCAKSTFLDAVSKYVQEYTDLFIKIYSDHHSFVQSILETLISQHGENLDSSILQYSQGFPYDDSLVLVTHDKFRFYLYNQVTKDIKKIDPRVLERVTKFPKEFPVNYEPIDEVYNPLEKSGVMLNEKDSSILNHYHPPEYQSLAPTSDRLHPAMRKFFTHLFENEESTLYVLGWIKSLLTDFQNPLPILVLCGKAAIGKNTLVESILVSLVGMRNYHKAAQLSERFNSSIANCILHFSDETEVSGIIKRNLKQFHELYISIERKGVDVIEPERIHARFICATNNIRDLKLDYNDRKFSVPELTSKKLLENLSEEEVQFLFDFKNNLQEQKNFAQYVIDNFDPIYQPYHGPLFEQICYETLPAWFRSFLKLADSPDPFTFKDLKHKLDVKNISIDTVLHQLESYEHQIGKRIAEYYLEYGVGYFRKFSS